MCSYFRLLASVVSYVNEIKALIGQLDGFMLLIQYMFFSQNKGKSNVTVLGSGIKCNFKKLKTYFNVKLIHD